MKVLLERVKSTGIPVREEMGTDCCYANEDKFWVRDPDGIEWEIYHLNYDLEDEAVPSTNDATCCTPLARLSKRPTCGADRRPRRRVLSHEKQSPRALLRQTAGSSRGSGLITAMVFVRRSCSVPVKADGSANSSSAAW